MFPLSASSPNIELFTFEFLGSNIFGDFKFDKKYETLYESNLSRRKTSTVYKHAKRRS